MKSGRPNKITEVTRRDILDALLLDDEPFYGRLGLIQFLRRVWPLQTMPSTDHRFDNAEGDIWQHMVNNSDWTDDHLLYGRLDTVDMPDEQFAVFLETCVHPLAFTSPARTERLLALFKEKLSLDGFLIRPEGNISGRPFYKVVSASTTDGLGNAYEVVLSFAGENRPYVQEVADVLKANDVSVFYDYYEEVTLWGKDLTEHLHKVYSGSARFCVMFISTAYAEKIWPTHERRSAFERAMQSKEEYILPVRFDDTPITGLHSTIGYIDLQGKTPSDLANLILRKLGRHSVV